MVNTFVLQIDKMYTHSCVVALGLQFGNLFVTFQQRFARLRQLLREAGKFLQTKFEKDNTYEKLNVEILVCE